MAVSITYHGHACFTIRTDSANLLIDPFLTGNAMADVTPEQVNPTYILISHAHGDHLGDAVPIAKADRRAGHRNYEIANYMEKHGIEAHAMHIGGARQFPIRQGQADDRPSRLVVSRRVVRRQPLRLPAVARG